MADLLRKALPADVEWIPSLRSGAPPQAPVLSMGLAFFAVSELPSTRVTAFLLPDADA
jgi:hypothetical protein